MELSEFVYEKFGISHNIWNYACKIEKDLELKFKKIDEITEFNQLKVLAAMQKNKLSDTHFAATTGYGYNDLGRDTLEQV